MSSENNQSLIINPLALRKLVGFLAFLLPVVVAIGAPAFGEQAIIQNSISDYYYTIMRNYFVGTLCAVAVVLFCYKGYEKQDDMAGDIAALLALMVAFFPTTPEHIGNCNGMCREEFFGIVHLAAAALLFLVLAYFSIKLFTKSNTPKKHWEKPKRRRNAIYVTCGWIMIGCMVALVPFFVFEGLTEIRQDFKIVFILEFAMLWAFGISWLTKGEIIFGD